VADVSSVHLSVGVAALSGVACMALAQRFVRERDAAGAEDLTPSRVARTPVTRVPPGSGRVVVQLEYLIDPARATEFRALMQDSRRSRLRQGALDWALLHDLAQPGRFVEQITDASWTEHLRRFERLTTGDLALRERKLAFHLPDTPPVVTRYVLEQPTARH
jgi:quinol monooxygenase YgiN